INARALTRAIRYAAERHLLMRDLQQHATELERRNNEIEAELRLARELQQSYLPRHRVVFPRAARNGDAALRFCFRYAPSRALGGDFFQVFEISEQEVGVLICDVMGHGVAAALVSATIRGL